VAAGRPGGPAPAAPPSFLAGVCRSRRLPSSWPLLHGWLVPAAPTSCGLCCVRARAAGWWELAADGRCTGCCWRCRVGAGRAAIRLPAGGPSERGRHLRRSVEAPAAAGASLAWPQPAAPVAAIAAGAAVLGGGTLCPSTGRPSGPLLRGRLLAACSSDSSAGRFMKLLSTGSHPCRGLAGMCLQQYCTARSTRGFAWAAIHVCWAAGRGARSPGSIVMSWIISYLDGIAWCVLQGVLWTTPAPGARWIAAPP
jgi:hypothetical protein